MTKYITLSLALLAIACGTAKPGPVKLASQAPQLESRMTGVQVSVLSEAEVGLLFYRDAVDFESCAAKERSRSQERTSWKVIAKVCSIGFIEGVVKGDVGTKDLNPHEIVCCHVGQVERLLHVVHYESHFFFDGFGRPTRFGIDSDVP